MPAPGTLFGLMGTVYLTLLGGFAAIAATTAAQEGDRQGLPMRVFWSITKTTCFLGVPMLLAVIVLLASESPGNGGGIMSRNMGLFVMTLFGMLGLLAVWVGTVVMGLLGAAVARNLPALAAGATVFAFCAGGIPLMLSLFKAQQLEDARKQAQRNRR